MKKKEFLIISIGVFLTVIAWLIVDVYHIQTVDRQKETETKTAVMPNYQTDKQIINILKKKNP